MDIDLSTIKPFEVCSIRPPTENYSLTFRLTRNCYWNKCGFCPAYKFGLRFSRRGLDEVKEDIRRAKLIDDLILQHLNAQGNISAGTDYSLASNLIEKIVLSKNEFSKNHEHMEAQPREDLDPRLAWFLMWFKDKPTIEDSLKQVMSWRLGGGKTCFMGDADSLILKPDFLTEALKQTKISFPSIDRYTVYGRTKTAARVRTLEDLKTFQEVGLNRIHFGVESGSDNVLEFVQKGVTKEEHIEAGLKTRAAGLSCSVYVMPGLGGMEWSEEHAHDTAYVLTRMSPDYVRIRSLEIFPQTPLDHARKTGDFLAASEEQVVKEIRIMLDEIDTETEVMSDSASNLLNLNGRLPRDRSAMLDVIDQYLELAPREKLEFSLKSRLHSFTGQYGALTQDILSAIGPYLKGDRLDISGVPSSAVDDAITLIRSKLMP